MDEAEEDARGAQLVAQLRTLAHLAGALADTMAAAAERGDATGAPTDAYAASELSGAFNALLPLLSARALAVPKVCTAFYDSLGALLELSRAPGAPPLSAPLARAARHSLRHGWRHGSADISRVSLEATFALAAHAAAHGALEAVRALVRAAQRELLLDLAHAQIHPESAGAAAANALLSLIVAQPDDWATLVDGVVARAAEPNALQALLVQLTTANGVRRSLDRPNRARFRTNLVHFLVPVRQRPQHLAAIAAHIGTEENPGDPSAF